MRCTRRQLAPRLVAVVVAASLVRCGADDTETAPRPDPARAVDAATAAALQAALDDAMGVAQSPGLSAAVRFAATDTLWTGAAGLAALEPAASAAPDGAYRVGSITKTYTAAAVLALVDDGLLAVDDAAVDHLPDLPIDAGITVAMLLGHTSGLFNYTDDAAFLNVGEQPIAPMDLIRWATDHGPEFAPGAGWKYSNTNFYVLALLVEAVAGEPLARFIRRRLLAPLALDHTWLQPDEADRAPLTPGHVLRAEATDRLDMSWAWASGGMVSTAAELCWWLTNLYAGDVLSPASRAAMLDVVDHGDGDRYGYAVYGRERGGRAVVGHTGSTMGFRSDLFFDPADGTCVAVLSNDFLGKPALAAERLWRALPGRP